MQLTSNVKITNVRYYKLKTTKVGAIKNLKMKSSERQKSEALQKSRKSVNHGIINSCLLNHTVNGYEYKENVYTFNDIKLSSSKKCKQ